MPYSRLQAIMDREHRAFVIDHIALAALLAIVAAVIWGMLPP